MGTGCTFATGAEEMQLASMVLHDMAFPASIQAKASKVVNYDQKKAEWQCSCTREGV